jgi:hypothetical protein
MLPLEDLLWLELVEGNLMQTPAPKMKIILHHLHRLPLSNQLMNLVLVFRKVNSIVMAPLDMACSLLLVNRVHLWRP